MKKSNKNDREMGKSIDKWTTYGCMAGLVIGCAIWSITKEYMHLVYSVTCGILLGAVVGAFSYKGEAKEEKKVTKTEVKPVKKTAKKNTKKNK